MRFAKILVCIAAVCLAIGVVCWLTFAAKASTWNPKSAAAYLDHREYDWSKWPGAARDEGTFCVSCHTALPYALARPNLSATLGESAMPAEETALLDDVTKRVRHWNDDRPYYPDMAAQSRGTEAVLNALILANRDAKTGQLGSDTLSAFDHMWSTQQASGKAQGAWLWIEFDNEPWEAPDSDFYGACLAAVAVGVAPANYSSLPTIQSNLQALHDYIARNSGSQLPLNRAALLWASANLPGLLSPAGQQPLIDDMLSRQRPDGGWSLGSMAGKWQREDETPLVTSSDAYATGLVVLSLEQLGYPQNERHVAKGRSWLLANQHLWSGGWDGYSLNKRRHDPFSMVSQFMNDASTAYAVLALTEPQNRPVPGKK